MFLGLGLPSDNNFQPITSFVSLALLGNKIVVGVTLLGYGGKPVTCCFREWHLRTKVNYKRRIVVFSYFFNDIDCYILFFQ